MSTEPTSASRWTAVADLGQSIWYDNVARPALASGHLANLVEVDRITGGPSNPQLLSSAPRARAARACRPAQRDGQDPGDRGRRAGVPAADARGREHQHDLAVRPRA